MPLHNDVENTMDIFLILILNSFFNFDINGKYFSNQFSNQDDNLAASDDLENQRYS